MRFRITLHPGGQVFEADASATVLRAALDAQAPLRSSCRVGSCRACLCRLESGTVAHTIEWPGLLAEEKAEGWILPCVARPTSDLVLSAPAPR